MSMDSETNEAISMPHYTYLRVKSRLGQVTKRKTTPALSTKKLKAFLKDEMAGERGYWSAAQDSRGSVREMFSKMAEDERRHANNIRGLIGARESHKKVGT